MTPGVKTLRVVIVQPPWVLLSIIWLYHGAAIDERFLVGMN